MSEIITINGVELVERHHAGGNVTVGIINRLDNETANMVYLQLCDVYRNVTAYISHLNSISNDTTDVAGYWLCNNL